MTDPVFDLRLNPPTGVARVARYLWPPRLGLLRSELMSKGSALNRPGVKGAMILVAALTAARLILALNMATWILWPSPHDDQLLLEYADLGRHFAGYDSLELAKTMSYPLFLAAVDWSGVPYRIALFGLWVVASITVVLMARALGVRRPAALAALYGWVLFCPTAFDSSAGMRIYRNSIIAPSVFTLLASLVLLAALTRRGAATKVRSLVAVWSGCWLLFVYYIKEDSIWVVPIVGVALGYLALRSAIADRRDGRRLVAGLLIAVLPVLILVSGTAAYKKLNRHFYGVAVTNERTTGPFADFMSIAYSVDDREQWASGVWVPADAWKQMWRNSSTLQTRPELLDLLMVSPWAAGDWSATPPPGDLAAWALHDALVADGIGRSPRDTHRFLRHAAEELARAQDDGDLPRSRKHFLAAGAPGRDWQEIRSLGPLVVHGVKINLFASGWSAGHGLCPDRACDTAVSSIVNEDVIAAPELSAPSIERQQEHDRAWDRVAGVVVGVFRWLSYPLFAAAALGFLSCLWSARTWRRRRSMEQDLLLLGAGGCLVASGLVVIVGVAWFASWVAATPQGPTQTLTSYTVAATPCFMLAELCGLVLLARNSPRRWRLRAAGKRRPSSREAVINGDQPRDRVPPA